jgi:hypothetical protein
VKPQYDVVTVLCELEAKVREKKDEIANNNNVSNMRSIVQQTLGEELNKLELMSEDVTRYLLLTSTKATTEWNESQARGLYTSAIVEQLKTPITIDLHNQKIDFLFYGVNTIIPITINNSKGDYICAHAGANGTANITINNSKGDLICAYAGYNSIANITLENITGDYTCAYAGDNGTANITINNSKGNKICAYAGINKGTANITINNSKGEYICALAGNNGIANITINNSKGNNTCAYAGDNGTANITIENITGENLCEGAGSGENLRIAGYVNEGSTIGKINNGKVGIYLGEKTILREIPTEFRKQITTMLQEHAPPQEIMRLLKVMS